MAPLSRIVSRTVSRTVSRLGSADPGLGLGPGLGPGLVAVAVALALACSPPSPARQAEPEPAEEIDLTLPPSERADRPVLPPGLAPCPKDAPPGGGCVVARRNASETAADGGVGTTPLDDPEGDKVWDVPVGPDDPVRGPANARVTVVVFSDFECPFCRRHAETLERLRIDYPDQVRLVWKDLPLPSHPHSRAAAELARAARERGGDDAFWRAHDLLFEAQGELGDEAFQKIARALGLPVGPTLAGMRAARHGVVIQAGITLSDRLAVEATPTTFVNGRKLTGIQPYTTFRARVAEEVDGPRPPDRVRP